MSVFDRMFKLNTVDYKSKALDVIRSATHNKLSIGETERIYNILSSYAMKLYTNEERVNAGMKLLTDLKADWLTTDEKEAFVSGVILCECITDSKNNKGITYINQDELNYTKNAVLGSAFKNLK